MLCSIPWLPLILSVNYSRLESKPILVMLSYIKAGWNFNDLLFVLTLAAGIATDNKYRTFNFKYSSNAFGRVIGIANYINSRAKHNVLLFAASSSVSPPLLCIETSCELSGHLASVEEGIEYPGCWLVHAYSGAHGIGCGMMLGNARSFISRRDMWRIPQSI